MQRQRIQEQTSSDGAYPQEEGRASQSENVEVITIVTRA